LKSARVIISGHVQGVWYRAWTEKEATARGLDGWVRNRSDGTVEAVFSGYEAAVDEMVEACYTGPRRARVEEIVVEPCDKPEEGFIMRAST
jgi:acylphosphatase